MIEKLNDKDIMSIIQKLIYEPSGGKVIYNKSYIWKTNKFIFVSITDEYKNCFYDTIRHNNIYILTNTGIKSENRNIKNIENINKEYVKLLRELTKDKDGY